MIRPRRSTADTPGARRRLAWPTMRLSASIQRDAPSSSAAPDVPAFYAAHFRPDMIDLSASCPDALPADLELYGVDIASVRPGGSLELRAAIAGRYRSIAPEQVLV